MDNSTLDKLEKKVERAQFLRMKIGMIDEALLELDEPDTIISLSLVKSNKYHGPNIRGIFSDCDNSPTLEKILREPIFLALVDLRHRLQEEFDKL